MKASSSSTSIARKTRIQKTLDGAATPLYANRDETEGFGIRGGPRVRVCRTSHRELGFDGRDISSSKRRRKVIFMDDEVEEENEERSGSGDEAEHRSQKVLPVASRTRSKLAPAAAGINLKAAVDVRSESDTLEYESGDDDEATASIGSRSRSKLRIEEELIFSNPKKSGMEDLCGDGEGCEDERKREEVGEIPLKRKRFSGIDVLVPIGEEEGDTKIGMGIAKRTRSHFTNSDSNKHQHGTVNHPYRIDVESSESESPSSSSCSDAVNYDDLDDANDHRVCIEEIAVEEEGGEARRGRPRRSGKSLKRKRKASQKDNSICKAFVDAILEKGETKISQGSTIPSDDKSSEPPPLPLIFSFEDYDLKSVPEKSEYEKVMDEMWADFDLAMSVNQINSGGADRVEEEELDESEAETDPSTLCCQGKHNFIIDEQIGVICNICNFVELEIRYVTPSFATRPWDKSSSKKTSVDREDLSMMDGLIGNEITNEGLQSSVHLTTGTIWDLIPGIKDSMFPHQQEGIEFMWKNIAGDILMDKVKNSTSPDAVGGCVITHAPGTGKTRLAIVFLQTFLKVFPKCRPVILAPRGMLLTWEKEFKKWDVGIPFHVLNAHKLSGNEAIELPEYSSRSRHGRISKRLARFVKLYSWAAKGESVLGISYGLFERLAGKSFKKGANNGELGKILLQRPDLFIFDEGHTPRNERSLIWKALQNIETKRRIILSGTPFQNNLRELDNVLRLVRPGFADKVSSNTLKSHQRRKSMASAEAEKSFFVTSPTNGYTRDSIEELRSIIRPFVHVHNGSVLEDLPGLRECLILLNPPCRQKEILDSIQKFPRGHFLDYECKISLASIHPSLLAFCRLYEEELSVMGGELLKSLRRKKLRINPNEGVKTRFIMELVRLSESLNEKVLIFSQYIEPLSLIRKQLLRTLQWTEERVLQMDGTISSKHRQLSIDLFNNPESEAKVLLASTRACCEGISLTGASRVVLLDIVWNPSVERQAISRAYRLGQSKVVYTYHLITSGTGEFDKYYRQAEKDHLSNLVFPSRDGCDIINVLQNDSISEDRILTVMREHDQLKDMFKQVICKPKDAILMNAFDTEKEI